MNKLAVATVSAAGLGVLALAGALVSGTLTDRGATPVATASASPSSSAPASPSSPTPSGTSSGSSTTAPSTTPTTPQAAPSESGSPSGPAGAPSGLAVVSFASGGGGAEATLGQSLDTYFSGINSGSYATAYGQFSPDQQEKVGDEGAYARSLSSTQDSEVVIQSVGGDQSNAVVDVTFTSNQDAAAGADGQACTRWMVSYTLVPGPCTGGFCIADVNEEGHTSC